MAKKHASAFHYHLKKNRFLYLLLAIVSMIIGGPFLEHFFPFGFVKNIFLTGIFISAIYAVRQKKHDVVIAGILAAPMLLAVWLYHFFPRQPIIVSGEFFGMLFLGFVIICMLGFIFREEEVTREVIQMAIAVYLLMAVMWAFAYSILDFFYPDAFAAPGGPREEVYSFLYFSFITITTLGYGDIVPLSDKASSLAILEAVVGQMYLVVVVAWLVGMHVSRKSR